MGKGHLWLVATPLGNVGDFSERARSVVSAADCVLAEDTRRTMQLFRLCGVEHGSIQSFHDHNEDEKLSRVLSDLREGKTIALVSDAGTPLIADPGYRLVRACRAEGIPVSIVPGPSAPIAALAISGLPPLPFTFLGFLPRDESAVRRVFTPFADIVTTLLFFERADRLQTSLGTAFAVLGARDVSVCRELTKLHEEVIHFPLALHATLPALLGELTVVVGPPDTLPRTETDAVCRALATGLAEGKPGKQLVKEVKQAVRGWSSKELYALLETVKHSACSVLSGK